MQSIDLLVQQRIVFGRHGPMLVNLNDIYVGNAVAQYGEYGEIEWAFMQQLIPSGRDAVEVGANIGTHSVPLGKAMQAQQRRLLVVEAQPVVFQNLCANLALNQLTQVQAENCACADTAGWVRFATPNYMAQGNFGGVSMHSAQTQTQTNQAAEPGTQRVRSVPLDDLLGPDWDVGFIKIDVEGFEQKVLQGAAQTIARCRPVIYLENDRLELSHALINQLWGMGYKLWFHLPALFNPANFAGQAQNIYGNTVSVNMLCVPNELQVNLSEAPLSDANYHPLRRSELPEQATP